ncbi:MAG TPA: c-type cytochrome [Rhodanobacteraceae bacterium]|nr:c-type cytochrome [Rhodanobacteraceae bacterium]
MRRCLVLFLLLAGAAHAHAQTPPRPVRLGLCAACHGENGMARGKGIPDLAGQDADYLVAALTQYRSGERSASAMRTVAGALSSADIDALARWYAAQSRAGNVAQ